MRVVGMSGLDLSRGWTPLILLTLLALCIRIPFLDLNAYWYDELLSVLIYSANHDTLAGAIRFLGRMSVHPPLYQTTLYLWMSAFGDSEFATRMLSTLYIVGGTLFVLGAVKSTHGRAVGYLAAIVFTLTYMGLYYGLESRSYALSAFLAAASLYFCVRFTVTADVSSGWRGIVLDRNLLLMSLANVGLLLTHYHNVTFIAAQGLYLAGFVAVKAGRRWPLALMSLAVIGALPILVYAAIWGPTFLETVARKGIGGSRTIKSPLLPHLMFWRYAYLPNFGWTGFSTWVALPFLAVAVAQPAWRAIRRSGNWHGLIYPIMATLPLLVAWLIFLKIGDQKSTARYFIFVTPALAASFAIGLSTAFRLFATKLPDAARDVLKNQPLVFLVPLALLTIGPGAYHGLRDSKVNYGDVDYRNTARLIANFARGQKREDILIVEMSGRGFLNYYLAQFGEHRAINLHRNIARSEDADPTKLPGFAKAEFVILAYVHDRRGPDRPFRQALSGHVDTVANLMHPNNRGIVIYRRSR